LKIETLPKAAPARAAFLRCGVSMKKDKLYAAARPLFRFMGSVIQRVLAVLIIDWIKNHFGDF
jgi:hypothetical protein